MKIPVPEELKAQLEDTQRVMHEMNDTLKRVESLLEQLLDRLPPSVLE